jgi:hypothetical protein
VLLDHFASFDSTSEFDEPVSQGGLAMIDVGDDAKIADKLGGHTLMVARRFETPQHTTPIRGVQGWSHPTRISAPFQGTETSQEASRAVPPQARRRQPIFSAALTEL